VIKAQVQFQENLRRVRDLGSLAAAVRTMTTSAVDVSDIWRAQIVLVVSALDHFVHELARLGMIEIAKGTRLKTEGYLRFGMPLEAVESALGGMPPEDWVGETVREKHSWQSFQDPDKLADAIRIISPVRIWESVGAQMHLPSRDVKTRLKLIVDRRNKIAHEADLDPSSPGFRWSINELTVNETLDFIESLGNAIFESTV
jgi:hypothetical protein